MKASFGPSQLPFLADLLMAAAHADDTLDGREVATVKALLLRHIKDAKTLPAALQERIDNFDAFAFDVAETTKSLGTLSSEERRAVLEMLSDLSEADEEIDLAEDEFLREVAKGIGAQAKELEGLTVEVELLTQDRAKPKPPPLPKKK